MSLSSWQKSNYKSVCFCIYCLETQRTKLWHIGFGDVRRCVFVEPVCCILRSSAPYYFGSLIPQTIYLVYLRNSKYSFRGKPHLDHLELELQKRSSTWKYIYKYVDTFILIKLKKDMEPEGLTDSVDSSEDGSADSNKNFYQLKKPVIPRTREIYCAPLEDEHPQKSFSPHVSDPAFLHQSSPQRNILYCAPIEEALQRQEMEHPRLQPSINSPANFHQQPMLPKNASSDASSSFTPKVKNRPLQYGSVEVSKISNHKSHQNQQINHFESYNAHTSQENCDSVTLRKISPEINHQGNTLNCKDKLSTAQSRKARKNRKKKILSNEKNVNKADQGRVKPDLQQSEFVPEKTEKNDQMVTIRRVFNPMNSDPAVTITAREDDEEKILYTLINGKLVQNPEMVISSLSNQSKENPDLKAKKKKEKENAKKQGIAHSKAKSEQGSFNSGVENNQQAFSLPSFGNQVVKDSKAKKNRKKNKIAQSQKSISNSPGGSMQPQACSQAPNTQSTGVPQVLIRNVNGRAVFTTHSEGTPTENLSAYNHHFGRFLTNYPHDVNKY